MQATPPSLFWRVYSVWYRHFKVYTRHLISNAIPPFLEPLFFIAAIGIGLGMYIGEMEGIPYVQYLATGIPVVSAMYTASFECTFGTFIRMEFEKVYDGMIASSITSKNILLGELLFAGTKGLFFSAAVIFVVSFFGLIEFPLGLAAPVGGLLTGLMFAGFSFLITSFVKTINHFNFYFTVLLTPMFFFSGIFFPLSQLPNALQIVAEFLPLTHTVRIVRSFCLNQAPPELLYDFAYAIVFSIVFAYLGIMRLEKRLID